MYKQAKRCDWTGYSGKEAARDAIMYQTTDQKLRKSILAQNMSYQDSVGWGQSHEESNRKATLVEETTDRPEDEVRRLEVQLGKLQAKHKSHNKCQTCSRQAIIRPTLPWVEVHGVPRLQEGRTLHCVPRP